ncbi:MAG: type II toxin-antitoxin system VapC family toxin [Prosthecobacter sp.]|nr:type II toxin-antitoxin system VapC family toxin [Prosthecobacter sp.]
MGLIIDSSILIADERGRFDLEAFFASRSEEDFFIAAITASELLHGVERANTPERRAKRFQNVEGILERIPVLDFGLHSARRHAALWAHLESVGQIIGAHDLMIAATALNERYSVATLNGKEFSRVPGLVLADVQAFVIAAK